MPKAKHLFPVLTILFSLLSCTANASSDSIISNEDSQKTTSVNVSETTTENTTTETTTQETTVEETTVEETTVDQTSEDSTTETTTTTTTENTSTSEKTAKEIYYDGFDFTLSGASLKTALFDLIKNPTVTSYAGLYTAYYKTDCRPDGIHVWDMYSACEFELGKDENHSSYSKEGDNYNREHTIPQSIFKKSSPMVSDLFHVYPTDSKVNGIRSDNPHAMVAEANYTSTNGTKIGPSATENVSGNVCEPIDEYKGDFARTYFYFVTCYQDKMPNYTFSTFSKDTYPSLAKWAIKLYLQWSEDDPVSEKEINRNEEVYKIQKNRNPFIDYPGIEKSIWSVA